MFADLIFLNNFDFETVINDLWKSCFHSRCINRSYALKFSKHVIEMTMIVADQLVYYLPWLVGYTPRHFTFVMFPIQSILTWEVPITYCGFHEKYRHIQICVFLVAR